MFQGLVLDSGARTVAPTVPSGLVEFVGDSITAGALTDRLALDSYAWKTGERLGVRHTRIARAGYCLVAQSGCTGLSSQYFRTGSTGDQNWDFSRYRANAVVINLGTNDIGHGVSGSAFQAAYTKFLSDLRARHPEARLFAVQTLKKRYVTETRAAVSARNAAGDSKVQYVDTKGWLTDGADYEDGNGHPNEAGHTKFAGRLAPVIAAQLGNTADVSTKAADSRAEPGDPNIKFVGRWDTGPPAPTRRTGPARTTGSASPAGPSSSSSATRSTSGPASTAGREVLRRRQGDREPDAVAAVRRQPHPPGATARWSPALTTVTPSSRGWPSTRARPRSAAPPELIEFVGDSITVGHHRRRRPSPRTAG